MVVAWQVIAVVAIGDGDGGSKSHSCVWCCSQPHADLERGCGTLYISIIIATSYLIIGLMVNCAHKTP